MAHIQINSGPIAGKNTQVLIDDHDITNYVRRITFDMEVNELVTVWVEYIALDGLGVEAHGQVFYPEPEPKKKRWWKR